VNPNERNELPVVGWREWLALPGIGIEAIKAKVDTGARSSALHAFDIEIFQQDGKEMVRFKVHPFQRDCNQTVEGVAELIDRRTVRSSEGHQSVRPVILTKVALLGQEWTIELTLTRRDTRAFACCWAERAVRRRFGRAGTIVFRGAVGNRVEPGRTRNHHEDCHPVAKTVALLDAPAERSGRKPRARNGTWSTTCAAT